MNIISYKQGKYTYVMSMNKIRSEDFDIETVYGISVIGRKKYAVIEDISDNYIFVKHLFEQIIE